VKDSQVEISGNKQGHTQIVISTMTLFRARDKQKSEFGGAQIRSKNMDQFLPKSEQKSQKFIAQIIVEIVK
jgi:hypothetical protein